MTSFERDKKKGDPTIYTNGGEKSILQLLLLLLLLCVCVTAVARRQVCSGGGSYSLSAAAAGPQKEGEVYKRESGSKRCSPVYLELSKEREGRNINMLSFDI